MRTDTTEHLGGSESSNSCLSCMQIRQSLPRDKFLTKLGGENLYFYNRSTTSTVPPSHVSHGEWREQIQRSEVTTSFD